MVAVSEGMRIDRAGLGRLGSSLLFLGLVLGAPAVLGLTRLLPAEGVSLALRLAAATACVLLLPGAIVVRALGRPTAISASVAGALAWSLGALFAAVAFTFAVDGSIETTLVALAGVSAAALVPALLRAPVPLARTHAWAGAAVLAAGVAFAGVVWWSASSIQGDALFHLGRVTKLESLDELSSINVVNEFRDGDAHPGYAFPLWHAALAAIAKLAGVDAATAMLHMPAILTPLALLLAYAAGAALFRSWGGGIAVASAQAALLGFARAGTGSFDFLALPPTASRALLAPALLAIVFTLVHEARWRRLLGLVAASLAIAAVHPTYTFFVALPLAGFLVARLVLAPRQWREAVRIGAALLAILVPASLYALWLRPLVEKTASHDPDAAERTRALAHYAGQVDVVHGWLRLAPEMISRGGAVAVAGLLAVPFAALAGGRRFAAYVLGGSLAVLGVLLTPPVFDALSDAVSLSQSRRLAAFLPLPFALAGAASLVGRLRLAGCLAAFGAGAALQLEYPGEFSYRLVVGGPVWPVWIALAAAAAGLVVAAIVRRGFAEAAPIWTAAVALAFAAPIAVAGMDYLERDAPDRFALTPGLIDALRTRVPPKAVVFSDLATSYRVAAYAPVHVAAAPPAHVADTTRNRPYERRRDLIEFLRTSNLAIPRRYGAGWIVVPKRRFDLALDLPRVYEDRRFVLYRLRASS
jgi:uncharacterized protein DUF6541